MIDNIIDFIAIVNEVSTDDDMDIEITMCFIEQFC